MLQHLSTLYFCFLFGFVILFVCGFRVQDRPHWQDILPLKLSIWLYLSIKNLPQTVQVRNLSFCLPVHQKPASDCAGSGWGSSVPVSGLSPGLCVFQEVKQYYEDHQQMKQKQREEAEAEQEVALSKNTFSQAA